MNQEIDQLNRNIHQNVSSGKKNSSPVFLDSSHESEIELKELLVSESNPVTHRLNQDLTMECDFQKDHPVGLLESNEPILNYALTKISKL